MLGHPHSKPPLFSDVQTEPPVCVCAHSLSHLLPPAGNTPPREAAQDTVSHFAARAHCGLTFYMASTRTTNRAFSTKKTFQLGSLQTVLVHGVVSHQM